MQFSQIFLLGSLALTASCAAIPRNNNAATLNIREEASTEAASSDLSADADEATAYSLTGGWKRAEASSDAAESDLSADADEATAYSLTGGWITDYSSSNRTLSDGLWHNLRPAYGTVALDLEWAEQQRLPETELHPDDPTKGVYILDGYHQIHCLIMVRQALFEFADGKTQTYPLAHPTHCLDALRQAVMCRADDTPLYTFGDLTSGDGQWRQCRDWNALSQWAADHFAYGQHEPEMHID
ncbi:hypothetical protein PRZ48_005851 [Zasmidium cellare]|uniref:Uncharacterized protein n=1 Tax=Zasmidium cellare TaxID=395010 RepID=A0ABR0ELH9_ZASCE|nr:hypothetical protein PRZ48_005851 [Zasmidium cellare]